MFQNHTKLTARSPRKAKWHGLAGLAFMALALPAGSASAASDDASDDSAQSAHAYAENLNRGSDSAPAFAAHFSSIAAPVGTEAAAPGAVDLSTFEPPVEAEEAGRSLGTGIVSYYGRQFHGRPTASGERFDMNAMTAAHKTLPFGSKVRLTNPSNGRTVTVRINDRGPFVRGRMIDVSRAAAEQLGIVGRGHGTVELEMMGG